MANKMNPKQNKETIARLWSRFKRNGDGKCYFPCKKCKGLKNRRILITTAQRHCRQHDHIEGGKDFFPLVNVDFELVVHGGVNIKAEGNALMEEDDPKAKNTIEDVGISATNNVPENMIEEDVTGTTDEDDEDDDSHASDDDDDEENPDTPIIEKTHEPLYQGSQTTLISAILLLVNLKVMNGISNVAISSMLRYNVIFVIFYVSVPLMFFILTIFFHRLIGERLLPPSNILPCSY